MLVNTAKNQFTNTGFTYDAAGNMTNDGVHSYTYDAEGNIVTVDNGSTATYVYDALNHRVRTVVGSAQTEFVFKGVPGDRSSSLGLNANGQRVSEWNAAVSYQLLKTHYYWGGKPVAFYTFDSNRVATVHYQHQDWLGTERTRTSSNGAVEGTYTSLPWGDSLTQTTPGGSDQDASHFATLDHDAESNTDHAEFRQYSNTQGRFMSPDPYDGSYDPSNPQSMNRYTYALNNPLSNIDPSGLDLCDAYDESQDFCTVVYGGGDDGGGGGGGGCSASCQMQYEQWAAGQGQQPQFPNIGGSGSGGSGGGAPNNGPSYTHADVCAASALLNKGGPAALDILGTIPGEGNLLKGAQALGGFASVGLSIFGSGGNSIDGALTGAGFGVWAVDTAKVIQASKSAAKAVPVVGNVLSGISAWRDIWGSEGLVQYYNDCMAWKN